MMKKFKKVLSLLLVFVMALTMLPTPALAVVGESVAKNDGKYVEGLPLGDRDLMNSLRENYPEQASKGDVVVSETNGITMTEDKNPDVSLEKGNAVDMLVSRYEQDEIVRVIVVLEGDPLLDQGFTTDEIAANEGEVAYQVSVMHTMQDALMGDINVLVQNLMPDAYTGEIEAKYNYSITMNGVAVEVPYGAIDAIAELDNVKSAYVAPQYDIPEDQTTGSIADPSMFSTKDLCGTTQTWDVGYTGAGMRIAVIDTGLDEDHPSFVDPVPTTDTSLTLAEIASVLENLNAYKLYAGLTAESLYRSVKVPFGFSYVDNDLDITHDYDSAGDHGSHVAGIATANKIDSTDVVGVAPDAQLLVMKVFGNNGGAYWDDIAAALEDCFWLNVDAVNLSLGSPSGFTQEGDYDEYAEVYARVEQSDMIASISAGNSYSAALMNYWYQNFGYLANQTKDPANGVVSSPGTYIGATVVASQENNTTMVDVFTATDGTESVKIAYADYYTYFSYYLGGEADGQEHEWEYVIVPGVGDESDYEGIDVTGKIAVVQRGTIAFTDKQINAADAGAVACIVYDNVEGSLLYMQDAGRTPNIFISMADGLKLVELAGEDGVGTIIVKYGDVMVAPNSLAGTMSDFSSWGVTPDLRLLPDITALGGNIYSCYTDGEYGIMSGTSMAAPHIAGMAALVLQYLRGSGYEVLVNDEDYHLVSEALLMSTAEPVAEASGLFYSPRKQGAGAANIYNAVSTPVYLTSNGGEPSVSFGDDAYRTGVYTFAFELNNLTGKAQTYILDASVLTDEVNLDLAQYGIYLMGETSRALDAEVAFETLTTAAGQYCDCNGDGIMDMDDVVDFLNDVNYDRTTYKAANDLNYDYVLDTADVYALYKLLSTVSTNEVNRVTVPAYGSTRVSVTITLSAADKAYMDTYYENGIYVDGFIRCIAENSDNCNLTLPFMGFYGEWSDARVFDTYSWYHEGMALVERYASILWLDSNVGIGAGGNPYEATLARYDEDYEPEIYLPVVSPNGDGTNDYIDDIYLSLMRNAKRIEFIWRDEAGNVLLQRDADYARQSSYQSGYGSIIPFVYSWWFTDIYGFNGLPNGSEVTLDINFYLDDGDWVMDDSTSATILVDTVYPEIYNLDLLYDEETNERKIEFTVSDDRDVAAVALLTRTGSIVDMIKPETNANKTAKVVFDVTEMDDEFVLVVGDYGGNERYYNVEFGAGHDHVRKDAFYGYRNLMNYIPGDGYIYLLDSYNGWHSFSADSAESMLMHTSMYNDAETVVVAADYVDGYIIGIDENDEIFAMKAGDWTRIPVGTFELSYPYYEGPVLDMAYDFANNVMYVLTDEEYTGAGGVLATIDLLTGEVKAVGKITMPEDHPGQLLTLACDNDGVLYAISYVAGAEAGDEYTGDLYIVDLENMVPSTDRWTAGKVPVKYVGETGYIPDYRQSMTVDHDTNELYWMAYASPYATDPATFFHVDKTTGELTVVSDVEYDSWMTAIFKPYLDCGDILPAVQLEAINLDKDSIAMSVGATAVLTATPYLYYADLGELKWESSDPTVATVNDDGVVTGVGEGRTVITVTSGEVSATCVVDVVDLNADLTLYDWGNDAVWMQLNASAPGNAVVLEDTITPSSPYNGFMAAAYFDGWVYMSESAGNFYRVDPETMQGSLLGSSQTTLFAMAFNYYDGFMYAIEQQQISMWESAYNLVRVNLANGEIERVTQINSQLVPLGGLAIDHNGYFYSVMGDNMTGGMYLVRWTLMENQMMFDVMAPVNFEGLYNYTSMVYSAEDEGLYISDNAGQLIWIDLNSLNSEDGLRTVTVGTIGEQYSAMNMAMFTIPETEPTVRSVKVESVTLPGKYMVLEGGSVSASVSILPWNAYPEVTYAVDNTAIATVDANGIITGVKAGETTLRVTVEGVTYERTIAVAESTGYLHGYVLDDFSGGGLVFAQFADTAPATDIQAFYGDDRFNVFSGAYFNGTLYAYGQDQYGDLGYYYYFLQIDPNTLEMTNIARMPYNLRDMAFDYSTGNLYAIAQGGTLVGAVVQLDMETGELTIIADTGVTFVAMTIDADGQMYGIGEDDYLYAINKKTGDVEQIGDTGVDAGDLYQSMHYDLDTGNVYWAQVAADQTSSLRLVDLETGTTSGLGSISPAGAMLTMMYTIPGEEPTVPGGDATEAGIVIDDRATTHIGGTVKIDATILADVELVVPGSTAGTDGVGSTEGMTITWTSSDETVAKVDADGVVTGVGEGTATITAQVGEYTDTCLVTITKEARKYYAYDKSNKQWISFAESDLDTGKVTVEREDAEGETALQATFYVQEQDTVYAIDEYGAIYSIAPDTFIRTVFGEGLGTTYTTYVQEYDWEFDEYYDVPVDCTMKAVDMSYDNGKLYVLLIADGDDGWTQLSVIYEIDVATGESKVVFESQEIRAANLYVHNGRAFMVDAMMSGMICYVDLYSAEQKFVQDVLIKQYWGDPWSGCALFEDMLTGTIYVIRDMTDTSGDYDENWELIPWDGVTGDSVLYILGLADGSLIRLGEIGENLVIRGMFIR